MKVRAKEGNERQKDSGRNGSSDEMGVGVVMIWAKERINCVTEDASEHILYAHTLVMCVNEYEKLQAIS
jgi:hypothetical protein